MYLSNESQNESLKFKLIVVGDQNTGKSCILTFLYSYKLTLGINYIYYFFLFDNING